MNQEYLNELIKLSLERNEKAFREIVEYFRKPIFSFVFRMVCNEDDAKDIVQDTFIRIWLHLSDYKKNKKFSTWIYAIAANRCLDRLRAGKNVLEKIDIDAGIKEISSKENIERSLMNSELAAIIATLTHELPPKQKLYFTLRYFEDMELEEIASITGSDAIKIKNNLYIARKTIRDKIEKFNK